MRMTIHSIRREPETDAPDTRLGRTQTNTNTHIISELLPEQLARCGPAPDLYSCRSARDLLYSSRTCHGTFTQHNGERRQRRIDQDGPADRRIGLRVAAVKQPLEPPLSTRRGRPSFARSAQQHHLLEGKGPAATAEHALAKLVKPVLQ